MIVIRRSLVFRLFRSGKEGFPKLIHVLQHAPPCYVYAAVFQPLVLEIGRGVSLGDS